MSNGEIDRMAIAIVDGGQSKDLLQALNDRRFPATVIDAEGGFLHETKVTLIVGLSHERLQEFFAVVRESCPSRTRYMPMGVELSLSPGYPVMIEVRVGGAVVFVVPVERFVRL